MQTSIDDLTKIKGVKMLMEKSKLELNGNAIIAAAALINWLNQLELRIKDDQEKIMPNEIEEHIREICT